MRKLVSLALLCGALAACGEDAPPPAKSKPGPAASASAKANPSGAPGPLVLKPKVDKQYRKDLTASDFTGDPSGDISRDPFQSYLVAPQTQGPTTPVQDECENHKVADKYAYNDLRLLGIVMRGSRNFAMFRDPTGYGQTAYQGDCLSKDKARIIEITPSCVRIEIRGEAPPGAAAPPAHEDKRCLHPNDIEIQ